MNSSLFSLTAVIVAALALAGTVAAWWNLRSLNQLRHSFFSGSGGADLERLINRLAENQQILQQGQDQLKHNLATLEKNFRFAVQKVGVVRFNPFADGGGNFSFSLALLDGQDSGLVITSMHGREQNRIYSKKIQNGASENQMTEEEQEAVRRAVSYHHKQTNENKTA
jgi:hypothetical protein